MAVVSTFNIGLQLAVEETYKTPPANKKYFEGGRFVDVTLDTLPDYADRQATIFPSGSAGQRTMNNRRPIVGRKWSDGSISLPASSEVLAPIIYSAMGNVAVTVVPSVTPPVAVGTVVLATTEYTYSDVAIADDKMFGILLRTDATVQGNDCNITLVVSGTNTNGEPITETITTTLSPTLAIEEFELVTRTSWKVGTTISVSFIPVEYAIEVVTVAGFKYFEYLYTLNNTSAPTLTMNRVGDPTSGAGNIFTYSGVVTQSFGVNTPADQRDGLVTISAKFEGHPGDIIPDYAENMLSSTSSVGVWPSWGLSFTKNGVTWLKAVNASLELSTGAQNYRTAAGVQNPQGAFFGGVEATGSFQILADNEDEFREWQGASSLSLVANWETAYILSGSVTHGMTASMLGAYFDGDLTSSENNNMFQLSGSYRCVDSGDSGLISFSLRTNISPMAITGDSIFA